MNDDALAAVIAAAHLLLARDDAEAAAPRVAGHWKLAGRLRTRDATAVRVAHYESRWTLRSRLRD